MKRDAKNRVWPTSLASRCNAALSRSLRESLLRHEALRRRCIRKATTRDLHDLRVESRRQLALVALAGGLGASGVGKVRRLLKRCLRASSSLRDSDVLLALVNQLRPEYPEIGKFRRRLRDRKRTSREETQRRLKRDKRKLSRHVDALVEATRRLPANENSVTAMTRALSDSAEKVRELGAAARRDESQLHRARVALKQLRYTVEALGPFLPGARKAWMEGLREAQHKMGGIHDLDVLAASIDEYTSHRPRERSQLRDVRATIAQRARRLYRTLDLRLPSLPATLQPKLRPADRTLTPAR
jgi:CHAD domain-containing protein